MRAEIHRSDPDRVLSVGESKLRSSTPHVSIYIILQVQALNEAFGTISDVLMEAARLYL